MKPEEKKLTEAQVGSIVKMLGLTRDREFNCSECLQHVSEFAECQIANQPLDEVLASVEQHLALCPECREEFEALMKILKAGY
jgi:uncharacterized protein with PIN domain